jgi:hypothetical protein
LLVLGVALHESALKTQAPTMNKKAVITFFGVPLGTKQKEGTFSLHMQTRGKHKQTAGKHKFFIKYCTTATFDSTIFFVVQKLCVNSNPACVFQ